MADWSDFLVAQASAAAVLVGLVFVGLSLNLQKILSFEYLPERAAATMIVLTTVLFACTFLMIPDQRIEFAGLEILVTGMAGWLLVTRVTMPSRFPREEQYRQKFIINFLLGQGAMLPFIIAGIVMLTRGAGGIYWIVPGIVLAYALALLNSWVLLVEINR